MRQCVGVVRRLFRSCLSPRDRYDRSALRPRDGPPLDARRFVPLPRFVLQPVSNFRAELEYPGEFSGQYRISNGGMTQSRAAIPMLLNIRVQWKSELDVRARRVD